MTSKRYRIYICHGPTCGAHAGALMRSLENQLWTQGLDDQVELAAGACLGRCEQGPNLVIYPGPVYYTGLSKESVYALIARHLAEGHAPAGGA